MYKMYWIGRVDIFNSSPSSFATLLREVSSLTSPFLLKVVALDRLGTNCNSKITERILLAVRRSLWKVLIILRLMLYGKPLQRIRLGYPCRVLGFVACSHLEKLRHIILIILWKRLYFCRVFDAKQLNIYYSVQSDLRSTNVLFTC